LKRGETTRVELSAGRRAPAATGRSVVLRGRVASDTGVPIADATVHARSAAATQSDEAGLYETAPFAPGSDELAVEVTSAGFARQVVKRKRAELAASPAAVSAATGRESHDVVELDLVLHRGLSIRGIVVDERDRPVEHVLASLTRHDESSGRDVVGPTHG